MISFTISEQGCYWLLCSVLQGFRGNRGETGLPCAVGDAGQPGPQCPIGECRSTELKRFLGPVGAPGYPGLQELRLVNNILVGLTACVRVVSSEIFGRIA